MAGLHPALYRRASLAESRCGVGIGGFGFGFGFGFVYGYGYGYDTNRQTAKNAREKICQ